MKLCCILLQSTPAQPADWILFFGHFHPLIVHLPIGFLLIAGLLELDRLTRRQRVSSHTVTLILFWSAVSATLACVFGYFLSLGGGYEEEILTDHQWQGIGVAVFAWIAWAVKYERIGNRIPFGRVVYLPALGVALLLLLAAGHHGGALTHGSDYLTQYTPEPIRSLAGIPPRQVAVAVKPITDVNQALVYEQIVQPILQTRCVQCHNAEKSKADLRLDNPNMIRKGGEDGPVIVAGKGPESELVKVCLLPLEDDQHMPPKGKTQLTDGQIALLTWWINQGASFDKKVADLQVTEEVKPALASLGPGGAPAGSAVASATGPAPESPVLTMKVPVPDAKAVDELKKASLLVMPLSRNQNQLEVSAVNARSFNDAQAALLSRLPQQIVWLKLGDTEITDAALMQVAKLKNLQKLHLEQTKITDAGLKQLKSLPYLEYLNLYGTAVTDAGLRDLAGMKNLKTVYLWQTKVTDAGVAELKKALPAIDVNRGLGENTIADFTKVSANQTEKPITEKAKK